MYGRALPFNCRRVSASAREAPYLGTQKGVRIILETPLINRTLKVRPQALLNDAAARLTCLSEYCKGRCPGPVPGLRPEPVGRAARTGVLVGVFLA